MNNPADIEIDIDEQRRWLIEHKANHKFSWAEIAGPMGVKTSTLSLFGGGSYQGRNDEIAKKVYRYRQTLATQARLNVEAPEIPGFFNTDTSADILNLLAWAHRGRLTLIAGTPGIGKTTTAEEYAARASNAWIVTIRPDLKSVFGLICEILKAIGDPVSTGRTQGMGSRLVDKLTGSNGLLIVDDAQLLSHEMAEQIRCLWDSTKVNGKHTLGVALIGNNRAITRMQGDRSEMFAQLYSRIGMRMVRNASLRSDVEALADAWHIFDEKLVAKLIDIGLRPGGLRSCTFVLELASMIAFGNSQELSLDHITAAQIQLGDRAGAH